MMRDMKLVEASVVTDDSTGIWEIGGMEFGVPGTTEDWLNGHPDRPKKLADWLRWLADRCEKREAPFGATGKSTDFMLQSHTVFNCKACGTERCLHNITGRS